MALQTDHQQGGLCECIYCKAELPFEMPEAIVDACLNHKLVIFAGAGISTESPLVYPSTFYTDICHELALDPTDGLSFEAVMSAFEEKHGRVALIERIKDRLDYAKSFPVLDRQASRFHRELASLFMVEDIFTTNWDDYFERKCGATPFVTEADWPFWHISDRKVFKIHGSITSPGSIVATEADYRKCYRELNQGLVGAELKRILATKTVVFIGFSFRDSDFSRLHRLMQRRMREFLPKSYVVTLDEGEPPRTAQGMHVIRTDGTHFLRMLKKQLPREEFIPDHRFEVLPTIRRALTVAHEKLLDTGEMRERPELLYAATYQDGLMDAFDHITANRRKGPYHHCCHVEELIDKYERLQTECSAEGRFGDVAYVEGYINGLAFILMDDDDRKSLPLYLVFGVDEEPKSLDEFVETAKRASELDPEAYAYAKRFVETLAPGVVFHHPPFL